MGGRGAGGGGGGAGGGGGGEAKVSIKDKAELADLKVKMNAETRYSLKWSELQIKYKNLYKKVYGSKKISF